MVFARLRQWLLRRGAAERQAMELARRYGLLEEYTEARSRGLSVEEALEEWDL